MKGLCLIALCSSLALAQACGDSGGGGDLPQVDCSGTVPTYTQIKTTALAKCTTCHSSPLKGASARQDAPDDINFDTFAAAKAEANGAVSEVNEGAMPPQGSSPLSADEKQALYKWGLCGTKE